MDTKKTVRFRLYRYHDEDLINLDRQGYSISSIALYSLETYARGEPAHITVGTPDIIRAKGKGKKRNINHYVYKNCSITTDDEEVIKLLSSIRRSMRVSFIKALVRKAVADIPVEYCFDIKKSDEMSAKSNTVNKENKNVQKNKSTNVRNQSGKSKERKEKKDVEENTILKSADNSNLQKKKKSRSFSNEKTNKKNHDKRESPKLNTDGVKTSEVEAAEEDPSMDVEAMNIFQGLMG